jgi:hypothetical protein
MMRFSLIDRTPIFLYKSMEEIMNNRHNKWRISILPLFIALIFGFQAQKAVAQDPRPELMYFRFDEAGQMVTPNRANPATRVTTQGTLNGGLTMGQTGQFGSALIGIGGSVADIVSTGWTTNLGNSEWTISMWINMVNGSAFGYYFGDPTAGSFRCFNAGVAGTNNVLFRGPFSDVLVSGIAPGPTVIHFVHDAAANQIRAYKNGVLHRTVNQGVLNLQGSGGQFGVGAYSGGGGSGGFPAGALMDEFRMYNRALSAAEIAATWDKEVDCFFPDGIITYELLDAQFQPTTYTYVPGTLNLHYTVTYPNEAETVTGTVNFYNVVTNAIVYTHNFTGNKLAGQPLDAMENIPLPGNLPTGYFRVEVMFNTKNSCGNYSDYTAPPSTLLLLPPGAQMCFVWPGDADNNGLVNYADRASLNRYIHEANLRSNWLNGPTRFSVVGGMDYLAWRAQPSAPWDTPDGCYKDTDGNGVINNFDYIAIKLNWMRTNTAIPPKDRNTFSVVSFDMDQNFPNPFNPTTSIRYSVPERSMVRLVVTDMFGREVATLANETIETGVHTVQFDAGQLASGTYIATISMMGAESGLTFNKTMKMALNK